MSYTDWETFLRSSPTNLSPRERFVKKLRSWNQMWESSLLMCPRATGVPRGSPGLGYAKTLARWGQCPRPWSYFPGLLGRGLSQWRTLKWGACRCKEAHGQCCPPACAQYNGFLLREGKTRWQSDKGIEPCKGGWGNKVEAVVQPGQAHAQRGLLTLSVGRCQSRKHQIPAEFSSQ